MKKTLIIGLLLLGIFLLAACRSEEEEEPEKFVRHWVGDIEIRNGIIYEFAKIDDTRKEAFSFERADQETLYHSYYYYDMLDDSQAPIVLFPEKDDPKFEQAVLEASDYSYFKGLKYFRMDHFLSSALMLGRNNGYGFIVKGYSDEVKKNIRIPETIDQYPVLGIGYKALLNAPIETLVYERESGFVLPYGLDSMPNLKSVVLPKYSLLFSMAISNCPLLSEVNNVFRIIDASLYNLSSLKKVTFAAVPKDSGSQNLQVPRIQIGALFGLYRSSFYLCPRLEEISGPAIHHDNNMFYYDFRNSRRTLFVKDDYVIDVNKIETGSWVINEKENYLYVPYLNDGLAKSGKFVFEENEFVKKIEDKIYYRPFVDNTLGWKLIAPSGRGEFIWYKTDYLPAE